MIEVIKDRYGKKIGYVERNGNSTRIKDERGKVTKIITNTTYRGSKRRGEF